jgi:endopolyphosphatase
MKLTLLFAAFRSRTISNLITSHISCRHTVNVSLYPQLAQFLHITDIHLDPYYITGSTLASKCHDNASVPDGAAHMGSPMSGCDSPYQLVNSVFKFMKGNIKVDFVVWTGDNARHDSSHLPKSFNEIMEVNANLTKNMEEAFSGVPIIPSFGNNDLSPHNILSYDPKGKEPHLNFFAKLWEKHIPGEQLKTFMEIGCFFSNVGPKIRVFSINTLYLYLSNTAVSDCSDSLISPGDLVLAWLESKLFDAKMERMQVFLSGHIPPGKVDFLPKCYQKFALISQKYRDIIAGSFYGHMSKPILIV